MYYRELDPKEFPKYLSQPVARRFWIDTCCMILCGIVASGLFSTALATYRPGFTFSLWCFVGGLTWGSVTLLIVLFRIARYWHRVLSGYYFVFWRDAEDGWQEEFATTGILPEAKFAITGEHDFAALPHDDRTRLFISSIASRRRESFLLYPATVARCGRIWKKQYVNAVAVPHLSDAIAVLLRDPVQHPMVMQPLTLLDYRDVLFGANLLHLIDDLLRDAAKTEKLSAQCADLEMKAQNHYDRFRYATNIILGALNVLRDRRIIPSSKKILPWRIRIAGALLRLMPDNPEHNQSLIKDKTDEGAQSVSDELRDALLSPPVLRHTWDPSSMTTVGSDTILSQAHRDLMRRTACNATVGGVIESALAEG